MVLNVDGTGDSATSGAAGDAALEGTADGQRGASATTVSFALSFPLVLVAFFEIVEALGVIDSGYC